MKVLVYLEHDGKNLKKGSEEVLSNAVHWKDCEVSSNDLLTTPKVHEVVGSLKVTGRSKANGTDRTSVHRVGRLVLLVSLTFCRAGRRDRAGNDAGLAIGQGPLWRSVSGCHQ